jgi:hypothetical protein
VIDGPIAIGPLPMTEGTAALAGLSRSTQAQVSLRVPLGAGWQGSFAAYHRDTDYAVDFGMIDKPFTSHELCIGDKLSQTLVYRHVEVRAMGVEAMVRRDLGRSVTGWLSYSLGKIDRDLGFIRLPHDYDQRHTLAASAQWRRGAWLLGASAQLHTGRPAVYPHWRQCSPATPGFSATYDVLSEPTHLRRLPMTWRVDLRAEREYRFSDWNLRLYVEIQNASLTKEVLSYDLARDFDPPDHVTDENTLFIPLPIFGLEVAR